MDHTTNNNIDELTSMADQQLVISLDGSATTPTAVAEPSTPASTPTLLYHVELLCKEIGFLSTANQMLASAFSRQVGISAETLMDRAYQEAAAAAGSPDRPGLLVQQLLMQIKIRDEMLLTLALEAIRQPDQQLLPVPPLMLRLLDSRPELIDSHRLLDRLRLLVDSNNGPINNGYLNSLQWRQDQVLVEKLRGKVVDIAKDPRCSEVLKRRIKDGVSSRVMEAIFAELKDPDQLIHVCLDSNGKYIVGELLGVLQGEKFLHFFRVILGVLKYLCCNINGSYVAYKLVDSLDSVIWPNQVAQVFMALATPLIQLMRNGYATKVIDCCLDKFPTESNLFFFEKVLENCEALAKDKHGCRPLQKCLEIADQSWFLKLVNEIIRNAPCLARDQYGNYVVQVTMNLNIHVPDWIAERLKGDFVSLSMHQCGSNVVEKVFNCASEKKVRQIVHEMVKHPNVLGLYQDQYGNYVVQKALTASVKWPDIFDAVAEVVQKNFLALDSHMFGKRIVIWLEKMKKQRRSHRLAAALGELSINF